MQIKVLWYWNNLTSFLVYIDWKCHLKRTHKLAASINCIWQENTGIVNDKNKFICDKNIPVAVNCFEQFGLWLRCRLNFVLACFGRVKWRTWKNVYFVSVFSCRMEVKWTIHANPGVWFGGCHNVFLIKSGFQVKQTTKFNFKKILVTIGGPSSWYECSVDFVIEPRVTSEHPQCCVTPST